MRMLFLLLLIAICSCIPYSEVWRYSYVPRVAGDRSVSFYVDNQFTEEELIEIKEGIKEWDYVLNGNIEFRYGGRHNMEDWVLSEMTLGKAVLVNKVGPDCTFIPVTKGQVLAFASLRNIYVISGRVSVSSLRGVMLHEIGHVLGLGHFGDGLMKPEYDFNMHYCVPRDVTSEVAHIWGFRTESMNYCLRVK